MYEIVEIVGCTLDGLLAMWFVSKFVVGKIENIFKFLVFALLHALFNIASSFGLFTLQSEINSVISVGIILLYSLLLTKPLKDKIVRKIVAAFIFEGTLIIVNTVIAFGMSLLLNKNVSEILDLYQPTRIIIFAMSLMLIFTVCSLILKFSDKKSKMKMQDVFLLIIFPIMQAFVFTILFETAFKYEIKDFNGTFCIAILLMFVCNILMYFVVHRLIQQSNIEIQNAQLEQQLHFENKRYSDLQAQSKQIRKIRHDMNNQMIAVKSAVDTKEYEKASELLNTMLNSIEATNKIETNHGITDFILNTKLLNIPDCKISVTGDASFLTKLDDLEVSIVVGNIIDNIVEAESNCSDPYVDISFYDKAEFHNIVFRNKIDASVLENNKNLNSTKKGDIENHGFGIASVKDTLEKYRGMVYFSEKNGMFITQIMIPKEI